MNIVTLTLSPAYDRFCGAESIQLHRENLVRETCRAAGGKGINISRALLAADVPSTAVAVLGEENGAAFAAEVTAQGVDLVPLWQQGRVRENITVTTPAGETRISFPSVKMEREMLPKVFALLSLEAGDVLTLTGRLPEGIEVADVMPFLKDLKCKGILLVIDSKSFSLKDLMLLSPWLIKPNEEEITAYHSSRVETLEDALSAATALHQTGIANVMISLGALGAVLVSDTGSYTCKAPTLSAIRSTVGAGDSSIAGFLAAHYQDKSDEDKLRLAVTFGSAACLSDGPLPPKRSVLHDIAAELKI